LGFHGVEVFDERRIDEGRMTTPPGGGLPERKENEEGERKEGRGRRGKGREKKGVEGGAGDGVEWGR
jgi:hypothetical protein